MSESVWDKHSWTDAELAEMIKKDRQLLDLLMERPKLFGWAVISQLRQELSAFEGYQRARKERP